jgi:hypothetical protein
MTQRDLTSVAGEPLEVPNGDVSCPFVGSRNKSSGSAGSQSVKSLNKEILLNRFRLVEAQRRVAQIESMIARLKRQSSELEQDLNLEHNRTKISDPQHFAYSPLAKSILQRHENLKRSIQGFEVKLEEAKVEASLV